MFCDVRTLLLLVDGDDGDLTHAISIHFHSTVLLSNIDVFKNDRRFRFKRRERGWTWGKLL